MAGHFSHDIVSALNEAVIKVFWTRDDMRRMLNIAGVNQSLINRQNWDAYKYHILSPIVDDLNSTDEGLGPLRRIIQETLRYRDCKHLLRFNNGKFLKTEAERALSHLRSLVETHDEAKANEAEEREARCRRIEAAKHERFFQEKLLELKTEYMSLFSKDDENKRGYDFESLLNKLFALFELTPHAPFRRKGEQIDGAFVLDKEHFLLEAKWQKAQCNLGDLRDLDGAVSSSLDNTLGLFIAVHGFSDKAI